VAKFKLVHFKMGGLQMAYLDLEWIIDLFLAS